MPSHRKGDHQGHRAASSPDKRDPDKVLNELRRLYAKYGEGDIPQHILDLARQIEQKMVPDGDAGRKRNR